MNGLPQERIYRCTIGFGGATPFTVALYVSHIHLRCDAPLPSYVWRFDLPQWYGNLRPFLEVKVEEITPDAFQAFLDAQIFAEGLTDRARPEEQGQ